MARRRTSSRDDGDREEGGRRRRYSKQTNWTGIIVFFVVLALLGVTAMILFNRLGREAESTGGPANGGENAQPSRKPDDAADVDRPVNPDRPPPEFKADHIQRLDALLRAARTRYAEAEIAEEQGKHERFLELMDESRDQLIKLHAYLKDFTSWLDEAKAGNWEIPSSYVILEKRLARITKFELQVPKK